jgi:hypothetical protein
MDGEPPSLDPDTESDDDVRAAPYTNPHPSFEPTSIGDPNSPTPGIPGAIQASGAVTDSAVAGSDRASGDEVR